MDPKTILETLGITREEFAEKIVGRAAESLLSEVVPDEDDAEGEGVVVRSPFAKAMQERVRKRLDDEVTRLAEAYVLPRVDGLVENLIIQETDRWGQKVGKPRTFIEYMIDRAETYLTEKVNYEGKSQSEAGSYGWSGTQTRVTHLIHRHLHYSIETAMKTAVAEANKLLAEGLQETARIKLGEIAKSLKVNVAVK